MCVSSVTGAMDGAWEPKAYNPIKPHPYLQGMHSQTGDQTQRENISMKQDHCSDVNKQGYSGYGVREKRLEKASWRKWHCKSKL